MIEMMPVFPLTKIHGSFPHSLIGGMMTFSFLAVSLKNLKRKTFRTGVLLFSIAVLVSLLIFAISFSITISSSINMASDRLGADLIIVPVGARGYAEEFLLELKNKSFYMPKGIIDRVKKIKGIESITYQTYLETIVGVCCDVAQTQVVGFDQDTDFIVKSWLKKSIGRPLKKGEAIAGHETYQNLGLELLEVGKTLFNNKFDIVGVLEKTGTGLDNALFMTEEALNEIVKQGNSPLRKGEISIIFSKVEKGLDPYYVGKLVEGNIVEVDVVARREMGGKLLNTLKDINKIFLITIIVASVLTVFLVWAIFSAIVNERSREIGIMRAVGAKESHIVRLFLLEVLVLGLVGSLVGMACGTYLSVSLAKSFALLKSISAIRLTLIKQTEIAILGLMIGTIICAAGALVPVNRIKKMEPISAIKDE
jgi:putative ABC transport system permease protein